MTIAKKITLFLLSLFFFVCVGCSNNSLVPNTNNSDTYYTVNFMVDNVLYKSIKIQCGEQIKKPTNPSKDNYTFLYWCSDSRFKNEYNFTNKIYKDLTLYAYFIVNAQIITNEITKKYIHSVFTIKAKSSKTVYENWDLLKIFGTTYSQSGQGSGVCFSKSNGTYYLLTNCHVAQKKSTYTNISYTVEDYKGKTYTAYLLKNSSKSSSAIDASYDLACLYFKSNEDYEVLSISNHNPQVQDDVIAIGTPGGQNNAVAFGKVLNYQSVNLDKTEKYLSNVTFDVIKHDAFISRGSSGGPLIDTNYNIIGINYALAEDDSYGYSIPASKIKQFLSTYVYE